MASPPNILNFLSSDSDVLGKVMTFIGWGHYRYVAGVCRDFRDAYLGQYPGSYVTSDESIVGSEQTAALYQAERLTLAKEWSSTIPSISSSDEVAYWACRHGRLAVLQWVFARDGLSLIMDWHAIAPREAASCGHVDCFEFLMDQGYQCRKEHFEAAASNGRLAFLQHFHKRMGQKFSKYSRCLCNFAARKGHLDMLQFLHSIKCQWDEDTCQGAAQNGHVNCLKYLHENGCPWYLTNGNSHISCTATFGGIGTLKYVHEQGCELINLAYIAAAKAGNLDCLQYLFEKQPDVISVFGRQHFVFFLEDLLLSPISRDHTDCLSFLLTVDNVEWSGVNLARALVTAAGYGSLCCLAQLLSVDQHVWRSSDLHDAVLVAARFDQKESLSHLLEFIVDRDQERIEEALIACATSDSRHCLRFLLEMDDGRNWSSSSLHDSVEEAAVNGNVECLDRLLKVDGVDWDVDYLVHQVGVSEDAENRLGTMASAGRIECVALLQQLVPQVNASDDSSQELSKSRSEMALETRQTQSLPASAC